MKSININGTKESLPNIGPTKLKIVEDLWSFIYAPKQQLDVLAIQLGFSTKNSLGYYTKNETSEGIENMPNIIFNVGDNKKLVLTPNKYMEVVCFMFLLVV